MRVVEAAGADGGVAEVDDGVPGGVEGGEGGADGDGFAGADFAGDDAEGAFGDAPADPGDGFGVGAVAVQHAAGPGRGRTGSGEAVVGLQLLDHARHLGRCVLVRCGAVGRSVPVRAAVRPGSRRCRSGSWRVAEPVGQLGGVLALRPGAR